MTENVKDYDGNTRIAVGIVVDEYALPLLKNTLNSAKLLSDNIFVLAVGINLDGQNFDNEESGIFFYHADNTDDESATRNILIDHVEAAHQAGTIEADWLVWMNPGDEFDERTLDAFLHFVEHDSNREFIYMMVLHRLFRDNRLRHDFDEETIEARLMPLRKGVRFQDRVKASLVGRSAGLMTQISAAPGRFLLPSKKIDPSKASIRANRTLQILDQMENDGDLIHDDFLAARAEAQFVLGNFVEARRLFLQLAQDASRSDLKLSAYYYLWETFAVAPIPDVEITKTLVEGLDLFPVDTQLLTFLGSHLQRTGKLDLAVRTFETAVQHGRTSLDVWHRLHIGEIAITSLALCHRLQNRNNKAIQVLEENREQVEDKTEYNRHLLDLYIAENQEDKASELAGEIWGDVDLDLIRLALKGACTAKTGEWDKALTPLKESYQQGCRDALCLRWYALALLATQQFRAAVEILTQWITIQPDNSEAKSYLAAAQRPEQFGETLKRIRDAHLRSLGVMGNKMTPRKPNIRIEDAVREMIQASGSGGKIMGFKPKIKEKH